MEKRLLLALVLSGMVLVVFSILGPKKIGKPVTTQQNALETTNIKSVSTLDAGGNEFAVETDVLKIVLSEKGGWVKKLFLKEYKDREGKDVDLIAGEGSGGLWLNNKEFDQAEYKINCTEEGVGGKKVELSCLFPNGLEVKKNLILLPHEYNFKYFVEFINNSGEEIKLDPLSLKWGPGIKEEEASSREIGLYNFINIYQDGEVKRVKEGKLKEPLKVGGDIKWLGLNNKYFLVALLPSDSNSSAEAKKVDSKGIEIGLDIPSVILPPGSKKQFSINIFSGPKKYSLLKTQGNALEKNIDFGFFSYFSIGLLFTLNWINNFVGNYGIAILLLTLVVKIILGPLTKKGFVSMQRMQKLQPEIEKLQKKHKDNPKDLNTDILQLYKERKINPFGGCMPLVLQIPIFWALFSTLRVTIELRQAKFLWWIKDLSMPDTIAHLPFTLPIMGNNINFLPVVMVITQVIQQNMMPAGGKSNEQKMMFYAMPVIFAVMFYNFPSGLVLYWTLNNILTIIQQYFIMKELNA